jgi:hypothetical protein
MVTAMVGKDITYPIFDGNKIADKSLRATREWLN